MKRGHAFGFLILVATLLLHSCSKHFAAQESQFENACWSANDTLRLEFENTDTAKVYQLAFPITLTEDYPFHNIYLRAVITSPSGDESMIPSEFILSDKTGAWLTEPSGDAVPFTLKVGDGLRFNQLGKYKVCLYHFMRDELLCGVEKAGIFVDVATN